MTLNVLYLSDYAGLGGGETSLLNLMVAMRDLDVTPLLHCTQRGRLSELADARGVPTQVASLSRWRSWVRDLPLPDFSGVRILQQLMVDHAIDVVHCNSPEAALVNGAMAARRAGVPFVWTCHGPWERPFGLRGRLLGSYVDYVVCVSRWVESGVAVPGVPRDVVYPGAAVTFGSTRTTLPELAAVPATAKKIGLVGRFQQIKGHDLFVDAALRLIGEGHDHLYFVLVGGAEFGAPEADAFARMQRRIAASGSAHRFVFTGRMDDMLSVYANLDLVVVASAAESFSMVTLEALAAGVTPVVIDSSAPQEITAGSQYGYLFETGNATSLARSILAALAEPIAAAQLVQRASEFSVQVSAQRMREIYGSLMQPGARVQ